MGTKNTTTTTNQYNPASMSTYNALQGPATSVLNSNINSPYNNAFFNQNKQQGGAAAGTLGANASRSNTQVGNALGTTGGSGLTSSFNASTARANAATGGAINNTLIMGAANNRNQSLNAAMNYRPLQTGGTSVQQTSGLGTWLPQVAGLALGAVTGAMGGGAGGGGGMMGALKGGLKAAGQQYGMNFAGGGGQPNAFTNPYATPQSQNYFGPQATPASNDSGFDSNGNPLSYN